jgi:menaquinone-dependent protoporphyrinogen IX oxidase
MTDPSRTKLLVVYGTRGGSTWEIAEEIARVLRGHSIETDVKSVTEIPMLDGYGGFVIGSGVYNGSWTPEALRFVRQHRYILAHGAVWLFSAAAFGDSHPLIGRLMRKEPREIHELTRTLQPRSYRVFAGVIDPQRWSRAGRVVLRAFGGRVGDNRDWDEIRAWAGCIAKEITPTVGRTLASSGPTSVTTRSRWPLRMSVAATRAERTDPLPGDRLIETARLTLTHAITVDAEPASVWPWLVQMGAGSRAGWYSYDLLDNAGTKSADRIIPALQTIHVDTLFPARPGATDGFHVLQYEVGRHLVLGWRPHKELLVTWAFALRRLELGRTRLIVRVRGAMQHTPLGLPWWLGVPLIRVAHFLMQRKQLLGIKRRAERHARFVELVATKVA